MRTTVKECAKRGQEGKTQTRSDKNDIVVHTQLNRLVK